MDNTYEEKYELKHNGDELIDTIIFVDNEKVATVYDCEKAAELNAYYKLMIRI